MKNISMKTWIRILFALHFLTFAQFSRSAQTDADALTAAAGRGDLARVESLLSRGVKIDTPDYLGWTPLYRTMINGHKTMVQKLLDSGANVNARNRDGATPLFVVPEGGVELAEMLLAKGANVNASNESGRTPLMLIIQGSRKDDVALWLLSKSANVNARTSDGGTALHVASEVGSKTVVKALLERKADVNARSSDLRTPLMIAARQYGNAPVIKLMLDRGANPNPNANPGAESSPLIEAATTGDPAMVQMLIERGADVKATGQLAMSNAVNVRCSKCLDLLVAKISDKAAFTGSLQDVAGYGGVNVIRMLLDHGADVNAFDPFGRTALMYAAGSDLVPVDAVKLLIERGADVNAKNKHAKSVDSGLTVLDIAKLRGDTPVVQFLIKSGAKGTSPTQPVLKYRWIWMKHLL